jgi:hypothetical protein
MRAFSSWSEFAIHQRSFSMNSTFISPFACTQMCERLLYMTTTTAAANSTTLYPLVVVDTVAAITHESEHNRC